MEKQRLLTFISKYHLGGSVESVKIEVEDNTLQTRFISDDKSLLGIVRMKNFEFDDADLPIFDTSKLIKMLGVLDEEITFDTKGDQKRLSSMIFTDNKTKANYMLADEAVIPKAPKLKTLPEWNIEINFDKPFMDRFIRSKKALPGVANFTLVSDGGKVQIVIGYKKINSNSLTIETDAEYEGHLDPISFSADYLKDILNANDGAAEATLRVSTEGLAYISFDIDDYLSDYYLVEQQDNGN